MNVSDQRYLKPWLKALGKQTPEKVWREFLASNDLPAIDFSNAVSAVYSANIEGNPIDVNSYLASKCRPERFPSARLFHARAEGGFFRMDS